MRFLRPGEIKAVSVVCSRLSFLRLSKCIRKAPASRTTFIIVGACFMYFFFVVSRGGELASRDKYKKNRGFNRLDQDSLGTVDSPTVQNVHLSIATLKSNVVYITLKTKRRKPAIIRGTVRPKSRKKIAGINKHVDQDVSNANNKTIKGEWRPRTVPKNEIHIIPAIQSHYTLKNSGTEVRSKLPYDSSIRIYSERAPPWFSQEDIRALRFLADSKITGIKEVSSTTHRRLLLFEGLTDDSLKSPDDASRIQGSPVCQGRCGLIKRHVDMSEVFAFHLDRILGLNRSMPTVCRKFSFLKGGHPSPVVLWDPTLAPADSESQSSFTLTWASYQHSLQQKCWWRGVAPKAERGCSSIHHYEWSKLALFDFLLQIYNRLDRNCCGFKPRKEDRCVMLGQHLECVDQDSVALAHIVHRTHDPRHLVFIGNKGYFDRDEANLDFKILEGIKELPEQAMSVLKSRHLREKLLQSLFLDQVYWESQGGRRGVEKLIDVIERRANVLLTYINAHGIKTVPMNE